MTTNILSNEALHLSMHTWLRHRVSNSNNIRSMSWRKHYRSTNSRNHRPSNGLTYSSSIYTRKPWLRSMISRSSCRSWRLISLASYRSLWWWYITPIHTSNIMDARSSSVPVHWIQSNKILLRMTSHLCGSSRNNKIPWDAPPVTFAKFFQTKQE